MNDLLATLSAAHFGAFTAHDAYNCGYHRQSLSQLVRSGRAQRVGPSAYVDRDRYEAASPERRHEMATRAVVRTFHGWRLTLHWPQARRRRSTSRPGSTSSRDTVM